jgi:hypothetical protein
MFSIGEGLGENGGLVDSCQSEERAAKGVPEDMAQFRHGKRGVCSAVLSPGES